MNVKEKTRNVLAVVERKVLPVVVSASMALSVVAVNAFAAEGDTTSSSLYDEIANSFKTGITDCVAGIGKVVSVCVPVAIGVLGLVATIGAAKKIFIKLTS